MREGTPKLSTLVHKTPASGANGPVSIIQTRPICSGSFFSLIFLLQSSRVSQFLQGQGQMHCSSLLSSYSSSSHVLLSSRNRTNDSSRNIFPKFVTSPKITIRSKNLSRKFCLSVRMEQGLGKRDQGAVLGEKDAVIIVDHGSRRQESNLMLNEFVAMFKGRTGYRIVEPAHMELAEPSIRDAFKLCVQQGANRVIISPFFLFPGRHWHQDISALAAETAKDHSSVSYIATAPLGLHELMVDVMTDRIKQCLSHVAGHVDECAVCAGTGRCRVYEN